MAKEYSTVECATSKATNIANAKAQFGWELANTETIDTRREVIDDIYQEVHTYGGFMRGFTGNDGRVDTIVKKHIEGSVYAKLTFVRDTEIKGHQRLVDLEAEVERLSKELNKIARQWCQVYNYTTLEIIDRGFHLKKPVLFLGFRKKAESQYNHEMNKYKSALSKDEAEADQNLIKAMVEVDLILSGKWDENTKISDQDLPEDKPCDLRLMAVESNSREVHDLLSKYDLDNSDFNGRRPLVKTWCDEFDNHKFPLYVMKQRPGKEVRSVARMLQFHKAVVEIR